jgi:hydrogenase maturation factor
VLCKALNLDPAGAIASGALLMTVAPDYADKMTAAFRQRQVPVFSIGRVVAGNPAVDDRRRGVLLRPARDEIAKLFD